MSSLEKTQTQSGAARRQPAIAGEPAQAAQSERPFGEPQSSEEPRDVERRRAREHGRGRNATNPLQIPWQGWRDIFWRTYAEMFADRLLSIAGGVAFFVLLAIFPAITALVSGYGLFLNAATITNNLDLMQDVVPPDVLDLVRGWRAGLRCSSVCWSGSRWVSVGSVFAAVTWLVMSYLFSWYLANFANYNATYGSLGAAVGLMMWLWMSAVVVLLGAELNAEIEHQTARDSTVGREKPLGSRGAVMADTVGAKQE